MCQSSSLKEACLEWASLTGEVQCLYTYTNPALGDAPAGWRADVFRTSYLVKDYAENAQIQLENPQEGCVYESADAAPKALEAIELIRSIR